MIDLTSGDDGMATSSRRPDPRVTLATWGVGLCLLLVAGIGYFAYTARTTLDARLDARIASLERDTAVQLAEQIQGIRAESAALASDVAAVTERVGAKAEELDATRRLADTLKRSHDRTARAVAANAAQVKSAREEASAQVVKVDTKVDGVSTAVTAVAASLETTRKDLVDSRRETTTAAAQLGQRIATNASDLSALRRKGEREFFEFDIQKASDAATSRVGDVRVQLTKADVRRAKYDVVLHVDDRRLEKKDRTMNEPVPFLVGQEQLRYELVVNAVDRDRIRGYLSVPKDPSLAAERPGASQ